MDETIDYKRVIEAALFMSQNAMSLSEMVTITGVASPGHVDQLLRELMAEYKASDSALEVVEIGGKFMFSLKEPYASKVSSLATGPEITKGALRILAYISKNDGMMQNELVKIFGSTTYDYMKELTEKEFVETKKIGRTKKIVVTLKFKEYFNV